VELLHRPFQRDESLRYENFPSLKGKIIIALGRPVERFPNAMNRYTTK
jgi:hypothetical protein